MDSVTDQIARLASQHHRSDYNRAKFGPKGSPVPYAPLSLHFPAHWQHLRHRQRTCIPAWSTSITPHPHDIPAQLRAAMTEPLSLLPTHPTHVKTSQSHPINISAIVPPDSLSLVSAHARLLAPEENSPALLVLPPAFALDQLVAITPDPCPTVSLSLSVHVPPSPKSLPANSTPPSPDDWASLSILAPPPYHSPPPAFSLGNLFLSSCPGKKVRLDGPVKGRSAVCRDLETDFRRMKSMGTGCIVCCLDDGELSFLGAPWPEYEHAAQHIGIDVLRLPMPEGLPPLTPLHLDGYLVDLITRYTLRGIPILVHCRGGVGRAGVVACCWVIRLGLCGWIDDPGPAGDIDHAILTFVHRVITYIRCRRSIKAVETYEQVRFLVDYVHYLRNPPPFAL